MSGIGTLVGTTALGVTGTLSAAASAVSLGSGIANAVSGGPSGGGSTPAAAAGGGSGGEIANPFQGQSIYSNSGVRLSDRPQQGESQFQEPSKGMVASTRAPEAAKAATGFETTRRAAANPNFEQNVNKDLSDVWADRLSKYLDYNTRALG